MITKQDLQSISQAIRLEFERETAPIKQKLDDLEEKMSDDKADLNTSIMILRAEISELETKMIRRSAEVREAQNEIIDFFDKDFLKFKR